MSSMKNLVIDGEIVEVPDGKSIHTTNKGMKIEIERKSEKSFNITIRGRWGITSSFVSPQITGGTYEGIRIDVEK